MDNTTRNKLLVRVALISTAVVFVFIIYSLARGTGKGTVIFNVVPSEVLVSIDGGGSKKIKQAGSIKLSPGNHTLNISQKNFSEKEVRVIVSKGKKQTVDAALSPLTSEANSKITGIDRIRGEGIAGARMSDDVAAIDRNFPLTKVLPINRLLFTIYPGKSAVSPNDSTKVAIYISSNSARARQDALQTIRDKGYDPSDYEIIFEDNTD